MDLFGYDPKLSTVMSGVFYQLNYRSKIRDTGQGLLPTILSSDVPTLVVLTFRLITPINLEPILRIKLRSKDYKSIVLSLYYIGINSIC